MPSIAGWMGYTLEQPRVLSAVLAAGVKMYPNTTAVEWKEGVLRVERSDTYEPLPPIPAAALLRATARLPRDDLSIRLSQAGVEHTTIGDAVAPGIIQAGVFSGHKAAREYLGTEPADRIFKREVPTLFI